MVRKERSAKAKKMQSTLTKNNTVINMNTITFTKTEAPEWLMAMWKEIDDKIFR